MLYCLLTLALSLLRCGSYRIALGAGRILPVGLCRRLYAGPVPCDNAADRILQQNPATELIPAEFKGNIVVIDAGNAGKFTESVTSMLSTRCVGFDLEYVPDYYTSVHRQGADRCRPAVIQISSNDTCLIYLVYKIGHLPDAVSKLLADPEVLKVSHGAPSDMRLLYRHFGVRSRNFVDLQSVCEELQLKPCSLKSVVHRVLGLQLSKRQQCSNWEAAELSQQQIRYAATDAWVTLQAFLQLQPKSIRKLGVTDKGDVHVENNAD
ncbi:3,5 exonuclease [Babesia ovis]|uniref:3,5 exonuclease n=1 Tax=Babesia ovis TaxID=5869 RepID=A0A9W5TC56_BABOV|nr:3,5 exonuclease [Babesia ovis]